MAMGQAFYLGVVIGLVEEQQRRLAEMRRLARRIGHPVQRRNPLIVGPVGHQIADIDGKGAGEIGHGLPFAVLAVHLQAADIGIGMNEGETTVIAMRTAAHLLLLRRIGLRRIIVDAEASDVLVDLGLEKILFKIERKSKDAHQIAGQLLHLAVIDFA